MPDPLDELLEAARAALPPTEGELAVPGLRAPVEVLRDGWGIPYLSASTLEDLWFAQGFVQASERLFQIDLALRASTGRLSELFAELTLPADRFARTIGWNRIGEREAARWNDASRGMVGSFVAGARAFVSQMPAPPLEYALLAVAPELPEDLGVWASAFAYVAWGLSGNWDMELLRVRLRERFGDMAQALLPPLAPGRRGSAAGSLAGALLEGVPRSRGQGSNNWVVAGSRTASGKPLLANDPHLLVGQPASWFEIHLRAPGYEARGVAFPFAPGIVIGTTAHHAWGITNVTGDVQDLYLERVSSDGTAAEFDGAWEPLTVHEETIAVRGGKAVALEVRETRHGPILDTVPVGVTGDSFEPIDESIALRWTATDGLLEPSALIDLVRAGSFEEAREAMRGVSCPGQNIVYADVDGTIGYQCTGRYPLRRTGDGSAPVPGWTSEHEWDGWLPFEDLPWSKDPGRGWIVTANDRIHDEDYPHLIGLDFHTPFRAERVAELLEGSDSITLADAARIQVDTVSLPARRLLPHLLRTPATEESSAALDALADWDGDLRADSAAALVYQAWLGGIAALVLGAEEDPATFDAYFGWREAFTCAALPVLLEGHPPGGGSWEELLARALADALARLREQLGEDQAAWRWGAVHRVRFAHPLARMPIVGSLFVAAEHEVGGDEQTVLQAGVDARSGFDAVVIPSWRVVVDLSDLDRSAAVLATGQSGNPASPHWNDQGDLWVRGELRPCPFTRLAVEAAAERAQTLLPG